MSFDYRTKSSNPEDRAETVHAVTFEEARAIAEDRTAFGIFGHPFTHERDDQYIVGTKDGPIAFNAGEVFVQTPELHVYTVGKELFDQWYAKDETGESLYPDEQEGGAYEVPFIGDGPTGEDESAASAVQRAIHGLKLGETLPDDAREVPQFYGSMTTGTIHGGKPVHGFDRLYELRVPTVIPHGDSEDNDDVTVVERVYTLPIDSGDEPGWTIGNLLSVALDSLRQLNASASPARCRELSQVVSLIEDAEDKLNRASKVVTAKIAREK